MRNLSLSIGKTEVVGWEKQMQESRKTGAGAQENRSWRLYKTNMGCWEKQRWEIKQEREIR